MCYVEYTPWIHWTFLSGVCFVAPTHLLQYWEKYAWRRNHYIEGLVQERRDCIPLAIDMFPSKFSWLGINGFEYVSADEIIPNGRQDLAHPGALIAGIIAPYTPKLSSHS